MIIYLKLFIALIFIFINGVSILSLLNFDLKEVVKKPYLPFCFGTGGISFLMFLLALLKLPFTLGSILTISLFLLLLAKVKRGLKRVKIKYSSINNWRVNRGDKLQSYQKIVIIICLLIIIFQTSFVFIDSLLVPERSTDGRLRWGFKAKILFTEQSLYVDYFQNPYYYLSHPIYPLLIPFQMANVFSFLGEINDRIVKIIFSLYLIMLIVAFYDYLRHVVSIPSALIFTSFLTTIPGLLRGEGSATTAMADVPIAFYLLIAIIFCLNYLRNRNGFLLVPLGLVLFFCSFTKFEGLFYSLIIILSFLTIILFEKRKCDIFLKKHFPALLCSFLLPYLFWLWFRFSYIKVNYSNYPETFHLNYIISRLHRLSFIVPRYIQEFLDLSKWHIVWILSIFGVANIIKKRYFKKEIIFRLK